MSDVFVEAKLRKNQSPNNETIQKILDENTQIITLIQDCFNKGRLPETVEYEWYIKRLYTFMFVLFEDIKKPCIEIYIILHVLLTGQIKYNNRHRFNLLNYYF